MIQKQLGERLKQYRMAQGYSQERFATICGLDRTYIAGIESGKRNITIENANKIATALKISLAELFDFTKPVRQNFVITINGENFILESSKEITSEMKDEIEIICRLAFDEEESTLLEIINGKTLEDLYEMSVFDIAKLLIKAIETSLDINVTFKPIELEVKTNY